jgi:hypothetical protein
MDSHTYDRPEPSHIHVPRPSQRAARPTPPALELDELCGKAHGALAGRLTAGETE